MTSPSHSRERSTPLAILALGALGVVYGDIGTSPLYALRECFLGAHAVEATRANVLGVLSLVVSALVIIVTLKYHVYVIRFDNQGEGGILALPALLRPIGRKRASSSWRWVVRSRAPLWRRHHHAGDLGPPRRGPRSRLVLHALVPATVVILVAVLVRRGTAGIGKVFGPIMLVWFGTLAFLGVRSLSHDPAVLAAVNPMYAVRFFAANGWHGFLVLGAVFLVATGGEALYADLGHFGEHPIQIDWFSIVAPSLLLNYFGQGALLIHDPGAAKNPFFLLAPSWALLPLVVLATAATIIASQAVISGAFSLTRQAVQLGYLPRMNIVHTSPGEIGQIYIPAVNWLLMLATIALVLGFRSSSNLAAAYGIAVTTTMTITTALAFFVARQRGWKMPVLIAVTASFLTVDLAFFVANFVKIRQGGWVPLLVAGAVYALMTTWHRGRSALQHHLAQSTLPLTAFVADAQRRALPRAPGKTAVFLNGDPNGTPIALLHNLKHNGVLHERNIFLTVVVEDVPHVASAERLQIEPLGPGFWRVLAHYGFMEDPDLPAALALAKPLGLDLDPMMATYFLSRNTLLPGSRQVMAGWRENVFFFLSRNASRPSQYYRLPPNRVIELGMQVVL